MGLDGNFFTARSVCSQFYLEIQIFRQFSRIGVCLLEQISTIENYQHLLISDAHGLLSHELTAYKSEDDEG